MKHHHGKVSKRRRISKVEMREMLYNRRFVLPNAVTMGNMFGGFLGIISAASGRYVQAFWAIIIAIILDGFDGRVARRFNATSRFGLELDSLSDLVSFGVAPAVLVYQWGFKELADEFGVLVCFVYCMCTAIRLARFNVTETNLKSFEGLPSPAAAGAAIAVIYGLSGLQPEPSLWLNVLLAVVMVGLGLLMVSRFEYRSIKQLKVRHMPMLSLMAVGVMIAGIWYIPRVLALVMFIGYALSAFIYLGYKKYRNISKSEQVIISADQKEAPSLEETIIENKETSQELPQTDDSKND